MPVPFEETPFVFRKIDSDTQTDFIPVPPPIEEEPVEVQQQVSKFNNKKIITEEP